MRSPQEKARDIIEDLYASGEWTQWRQWQLLKWQSHGDGPRRIRAGREVLYVLDFPQLGLRTIWEQDEFYKFGDGHNRYRCIERRRL